MIALIIYTSSKSSKILTTWTAVNASRHAHRHSHQPTLYQRLSSHSFSMPPKRTPSSSKRKAVSSEKDISDSDTPKHSTKKAKKSTKEPVSNGQPNNTVLPVNHLLNTTLNVLFIFGLGYNIISRKDKGSDTDFFVECFGITGSHEKGYLTSSLSPFEYISQV